MIWRTFCLTGNRYSRNCRKRASGGFTILELTVAASVGAIISYTAYSILTSEGRKASETASRLLFEKEAKQFLSLRRKAITDASTAPTLLGTPDPLLAPQDRVWSGIVIPRSRLNADGTQTAFAETFQTSCRAQPAGLLSIDSRIFSCFPCPSGQLPVVVDAAAQLVYPVGTLDTARIVSGSLCVMQFNGITTLRLLSLAKNAKGETQLMTQEVAVANPIGVPRFRVIK